MAVHPSAPSVAALRARYEQRTERLTTLRHVRAALVSLAGLIGKPVINQSGQQIGKVADAVARWDSNQRYPPVTGLIVRVGRRRAWLSIDTVEEFGSDRIRLRTARLDLRDVARRPGEVELSRDVVDHQLVDTDGARVIRARSSTGPASPASARSTARAAPCGPRSTACSGCGRESWRICWKIWAGRSGKTCWPG